MLLWKFPSRLAWEPKDRSDSLIPWLLDSHTQILRWQKAYHVKSIKRAFDLVQYWYELGHEGLCPIACCNWQDQDYWWPIHYLCRNWLETSDMEYRESKASQQIWNAWLLYILDGDIQGVFDHVWVQPHADQIQLHEKEVWLLVGDFELPDQLETFEDKWQGPTCQANCVFQRRGHYPLQRRSQHTLSHQSVDAGIRAENNLPFTLRMPFLPERWANQCAIW